VIGEWYEARNGGFLEFFVKNVESVVALDGRVKKAFKETFPASKIVFQIVENTNSIYPVVTPVNGQVSIVVDPSMLRGRQWTTGWDIDEVLVLDGKKLGSVRDPNYLEHLRAEELQHMAQWVPGQWTVETQPSLQELATRFKQPLSAIKRLMWGSYVGAMAGVVGGRTKSIRENKSAIAQQQMASWADSAFSRHKFSLVVQPNESSEEKYPPHPTCVRGGVFICTINPKFFFDTYTVGTDFWDQMPKL